MKKELYILMILSLSFFNVIGQGHGILTGQEPSLKCINKQEKKLTRKFKKTKCFNATDNLNFLVIYTLGFKDKPNSNLFIKQEVMNKLYCLYRKRSDFPISEVLIVNQDKRVVGHAEALNVYCYFENLSTPHRPRLSRAVTGMC